MVALGLDLDERGVLLGVGFPEGIEVGVEIAHVAIGPQEAVDAALAVGGVVFVEADRPAVGAAESVRLMAVPAARVKVLGTVLQRASGQLASRAGGKPLLSAGEQLLEQVEVVVEHAK